MSCWKGLFSQFRSRVPCWVWCRTNTPPVPKGLPREGQGSLQAPEPQLLVAAWKQVFREADPARHHLLSEPPMSPLPEGPLGCPQGRETSGPTPLSSAGTRGDTQGHTGGPWTRLRPPPRALMSLPAPHVDNLRSFNGIAPRGRVVTVLAAADRQTGVNDDGEVRPLSELHGLRTKTQPCPASSQQTGPGLVRGTQSPTTNLQCP